MAEMEKADSARKMVRFCIRGHEIVSPAGAIMRSRCPICGSPVDRTRPPVSYEQLLQEKEKQKSAQAGPDKGTADTPASPGQTGNPEGITGNGRENISGQTPGSPAVAPGQGPGSPVTGLSGQRQGAPAGTPGQRPGTPAGPGAGSAASTGFPGQRPGTAAGIPGQRPGTPAGPGAGSAASTGLPGQRPGTSSGIPGQRPGTAAGVPGQRPGTPSGVPGQRPGSPAAGPGQRPGISPGLPGQRPGTPAGVPGQRPGPGAGHTPQAQKTAAGNNLSPSGFSLEYFGERLPIPTQGAWIGREGLGREWFDGNLMISRKHVYVRPNPQTGRLQVNEDKSLNGAFYTGPDGSRVRIEGTRMMEPGEILWIYNIPLRIVQ